MAVTEFDSGTQTCVITTEHTLASVGVAGVFELVLDLNALANGDVLEVRAKTRILSGGTVRTVVLWTFADAQPADDLIQTMVPIANDLVEAGTLVYTIKQTRGTGRAIPWKVLQHA